MRHQHRCTAAWQEAAKPVFAVRRERALSAIALLFAILKTRPTPFCFLDEIEAALDDVNVYRFADYVKNYSKETQFIIVTHRRGTMECADVIYGVTMQEKGVSKLLELNINEIAG